MIIQDEFKIGDKVQPKTGGPEMIVISIQKDTGIVVCGWDDGDRTIEVPFHIKSLDAVTKK